MTESTFPPPAGAHGARTFQAQAILRPREQIEKYIRDAILSSVLKNGDRLPSEADLARDFGVSRNTVREALRALSAKGFIRKVPGAGGGSFVRRIDPDTFEDSLTDLVADLITLGSVNLSEIADVRLYLEVPATRLAATNRTEEDLEKIGKILHAALHTTVRDPRIPSLDASFHSAVAAASQSPILASFVGALHAATQPAKYLDLSVEFGREAVHQHERIVEAITDQDPERAEETIREHLEYVRTHMRQ